MPDQNCSTPLAGDGFLNIRTTTEFEALAPDLRCQDCGHTGLELAPPHPNNNGVRPCCPHCGSLKPVPGVQWLKQPGNERKRVSKRDVRAVWEQFGDHCSFCGSPRYLCERLHVGLTQQHIVPIALGGAEDGPVVPMCARCQEMSAAALRRVRDELAALGYSEGVADAAS